MTPPLTPAALDRRIDRDRAEFTRLNSGRLWDGDYRRRNRDVERQIGLLAERIERLYRFKSLLAAKAYCGVGGSQPIEALY